MRRGLSFVLLLAAAPLLAQDGGKVKIAKLYLGGERIVEGEVLSEDDQTITIKTELAEAPFNKKDILFAIRSEITQDELKARRSAKNLYTSLLLGYKLRKPDDWSFKLDAPEPLADVIVHQPKEDSRLTVLGMPDEQPDKPIDEEEIKGLAKTAETKLREKFVDVKRTAAEKTKFKEQPAAFIEFTMKTKDAARKEFKQGEIVFKNRKKTLFFAVWAPVAKYDKAKKAFDDMLASIEFTDSNPQEGDRLWNAELLYALQKPSEWSFAKGSEMAAPKNEAWLRVEPKKLEASATLESWAKDVEPGLAPQGAKKVQGGPANVCGRLGHQWVFDYQEGGKPRRRSVWLVKEQERGYQLTADAPTDKEQFAPLIAEAVSKFRILNNLLGAGALEKGIQAIELSDEGDKKFDAKDYGSAVSLYEQAIAAFPRYALVWNNMGVAWSRLNDPEKSRRAYQRAYELFSEDPGIRTNLAVSQVMEAMKALEARKGDEAERLIARAKTLAPPDSEEMKDVIVLAYSELGVYYANKENWGTAASWCEKALALKPKDKEATKLMVNVCLKAAAASYNKKNTSDAASWARKALKYEPNQAEAKQILDACKKSR